MTDDIVARLLSSSGPATERAAKLAAAAEIKRLTAERDALRDLLREAREYVADMPIVGDELLARIDAALKGGRE